MKHKPESWNGSDLSSDSSSSVRRSLTRAGLGLGQLSHVVSGALSNLQGSANASANPRGAAQNRMRALLNQDRALLSHRACGQASLENEDEVDVPEIPLKGGPTRTAAQNRMRELLNQDRAMLALREARRREDPASEPLDDDFAAELLESVDREWTPVSDAEVTSVAVANKSSTLTVSSVAEPTQTVARGTCVGVTASFVAEPEVASVCTPGPVAAASLVPPAVAATSVRVMITKPVVVAPAPKPAAPNPSPSENSEDGGAEPIRTRGMAKLLALQGYRDRALSIYDELIAEDPDNAALRAEADRLRN
jgi:hypothetical protein